MTTKEERRELLDQLFRIKKTNKASVALIRSSDDLDPNAGKERYRVLLNDIEAVALRHSRADYSAILTEGFDAIKSWFPGLMMEQLADPLTIQTAICDRTTKPSVYARRRVSLNLTILLLRTGLPLLIKVV